MTEDSKHNIFYYHATSTGGRRVRLLMSREWLLDKRLDSLLLMRATDDMDQDEERYVLSNINPHDLEGDFMKVSPSGRLPVLELYRGGGKRHVICGGQAITEYIIGRHYGSENIWGRGDETTKAIIRTFVNYIDVPFEQEVVAPIIKERLHIGWDIVNGHRTDDENLSRARERLKIHLSYFEHILDRQRNFVGDSYTLADTAAVASLTLLHHLSEIEWHDYPNVRRWYDIHKPLCKCLLREQIAGIVPPEEYNRLII